MDNDAKILAAYVSGHKRKAAQILESFPEDQIISFLKELENEQAASLLNVMDHYKVINCLKMMDKKLAADLMICLNQDATEIFLRQMDEPFRNSLMALLPKEINVPLKQKLAYPEKTAGALMDASALILMNDIKVEDALQIIRSRKQQISLYAYAVNEQKKLIGIIKLDHLISADPNHKIATLIAKDPPAVYAEVPVAALLEHHGWMEYYALPVINRSGIFLGALHLTTLRNLNFAASSKLSRQAIEAGNALGELYRIGLAGLLKSATD